MALRPYVYDDATGFARAVAASVVNPPDILGILSTSQAGDTLDMTNVGTTETPFASTVKIPANYLKANMLIEVDGFGSFQSAATGTQEAKVYVKPAASPFASTNRVARSGTLNSLLAATANTLYYFRTTLSVVSITGNNVVLGCASKLDFVSQGSGQAIPFMAGPDPAVYGTVTVDRSVDNFVHLTDTFGGTGTNNNTLRMFKGVAYSSTGGSAISILSGVEQNTAANLATKYANTPPLSGAILYETDTRLTKIGDGVSTWPTLFYEGGLITDTFVGGTTLQNFTWNKRPGAKRVHVEIIQAGSGGGAGRRGAAGTIRCGGGGGQGGSRLDVLFDASVLGSSENLQLGANGKGGAAPTTDDTNGGNGVAGGACYFGGTSAAATTTYLAQVFAQTSGSGGFGGTATAGTGGTGSVGTAQGANGAAASTTGGAGATGGFPNGLLAAGGGGSGGGLSNTNVQSAGGIGGSNTQVQRLSTSGTAGASNSSGAGGDGGNGGSGVAYNIPGGAGGGGGAGSTTGGKGGNGGNYGGGGGGGAAALNGNLPGAGGDGGVAFCRITTYF